MCGANLKKGSERTLHGVAAGPPAGRRVRSVRAPVLSPSQAFCREEWTHVPALPPL